MLKRGAIIKMKKSEKSRTGWWFLLGMIIIYLVTALISTKVFLKSIQFFFKIFLRVLPFLFIIFLLMALINYFIKNSTLIRWMGRESGKKGWIVAIGGGILSLGPIYLWYPLLSDLQDNKVRQGLIATFLYNRAVKPALLPLLIYYFGVIYTVVLTGVMILASVGQGKIVEKIAGVEK